MLPKRARLGTLLEGEGDPHCAVEQLPEQRFSGGVSSRAEPGGHKQAGGDVPPRGERLPLAQGRTPRGCWGCSSP